MKTEKPSDVETYVCKEGHLHIEIQDENGNVVESIVLDLETAMDFVEGIAEQIDDFLEDHPEEADETLSGSVH